MIQNPLQLQITSYSRTIRNGSPNQIQFYKCLGAIYYV